MAENFKEYLLGADSEPSYYSAKFDDLLYFFKERWMIPRSERCPDYKELGKETVLSCLLYFSIVPTVLTLVDN